MKIFVKDIGNSTPEKKIISRNVGCVGTFNRADILRLMVNLSSRTGKYF